MALLDACVRLLPGVMGAAESGAEESFEAGLLEYPHYTRPPVFEGMAIPEVLGSGHHGRIAEWRRAEAERITRERRPELLGDRGREGGSAASPPASRARTKMSAKRRSETDMRLWIGRISGDLVRQAHRQRPPARVYARQLPTILRRGRAFRRRHKVLK